MINSNAIKLNDQNWVETMENTPHSW